MKYIAILFLSVIFCTTSAQAQYYKVQHFGTVDLYDGLDETFHTGSSFGVYNPIYSAFPITSMIRHNRVDGLFLGYQEDKMGWSNSSFLGFDNIDVHGLIGYSFAQSSVQYTFGIDKTIGDRVKWLMLGGQFHKTTSTEDYWRSGLYENSVSSFTAGLDYHDYYQAEGYGVYALLRPSKRIEAGIAYNHDTYSSLGINSDYSLFSKYAIYRENPAIDAFHDVINQQTVNLGVTLNPRKLSRTSNLWTTISAKAELSDLHQFNNDFDYNKYSIEAKSYLRLDKSTLLKWSVMGGAIQGHAPDFKQFALGGIGSMRAFGYKSFAGNQMLLSNLELEMGKTSGKHKNWPDLKSSYISLFLDSGFSNFNNKLYNSENPISDFKISNKDLVHNIGVGLGLGMIRFEVAKPLDSSSGFNTFWIRLNPTF